QFKQYVPGMELGRTEDEVTYITTADLYQSDWLPGTIDNAFGLKSSDRVSELAVKQQIARATGVHPAAIVVSDDGRCAPLRQYPLNRFSVQIVRDGDTVKASHVE